jgi:uncharacterized protein YbbK (DUF523 family)
MAFATLAASAEVPVTLTTTTGEIYGTLTVPDNASRTVVLIIAGSGPTDRNGNSVDAALRSSVDMILAQVRREGIRYAILKSRSPTCGVRQVYDGTFSGTLINGAGVLAQALMDAGCQVIDSEELPDIL